jgi:outer membrane murein-binding lipoprotein Lpp
MLVVTRSKKLDELVSSVEDLLSRLPDNLTPEVAELRDKVDAAIFEAWTAIAAEGRDTLNRAARRSAVRFWVIVGLALLAGTSSLVAYRMTRPAARLR